MLTGLLIILLVVVGAATAVAGGIALARRRALAAGTSPRQLTSGDDKRRIERTLRDVRNGDIVSYDGRDYLVEGVIAYEEDGHRWNAGHLVDVHDHLWMMAGLERSGMLTVRVMTLTDELDVGNYPPEQLVHGGERYTLDKRGTATARMTGDTGFEKNGSDDDRVMRCRWWLYSTPGKDTVVVEQWGDQFRVLRGQKVSSSDIELMPAS